MYEEIAFQSLERSCFINRPPKIQNFYSWILFEIWYKYHVNEQFYRDFFYNCIFNYFVKSDNVTWVEEKHGKLNLEYYECVKADMSACDVGFGNEFRNLGARK